MCPCTSDVHITHLNLYGECVLGHEVVGEVVEVGSAVKDFKPGDKVLVSALTPDWLELEAQAGFATHGGGYAGAMMFTQKKPGTFAELFHVNQADANLAHLPEGMNLKSALMVGDMMSTGFYGAELADIQFGDNVCVIGIGPVGLMAVAACAIRGASMLIAVGSRTNCQEIAKQYGATHIVNYKDGDIVEQVKKLTNGKGVDKVIVAGGDVNIINTAIMMVHPGSTIANIAMVGGDPKVPIPMYPLPWGYGLGDITIKGGCCPGGRLRLEKLARLITAGRVDPSKLILPKYEYHGFDKIAEAYKNMEEKPRDLIKTAVFFD
jgi:threonine dehydrogenase-like Zn-dependent dehydrogenase